MMHADGHRCNNDCENCGWLCDTASKPSTLLACRLLKRKISPEGLDIDRLECSISQTVKRYFIRFYRRSSVFIL